MITNQVHFIFRLFLFTSLFLKLGLGDINIICHVITYPWPSLPRHGLNYGYTLAVAQPQLSTAQLALRPAPSSRYLQSQKWESAETRRGRLCTSGGPVPAPTRCTLLRLAAYLKRTGVLRICERIAVKVRHLKCFPCSQLAGKSHECNNNCFQ